ncbi:conserved hypothetical protein, partial [Perkinsus marinus ATCC 50983]
VLEISATSAWRAGDDRDISSSTATDTHLAVEEGVEGDRFFIGTPHDGPSDISWVETSSESSVSPTRANHSRLVPNGRPETQSPDNKAGWLSSWLGRSRAAEEPMNSAGSDRWEVSSGTSITSGASGRGRSLSRSRKPHPSGSSASIRSSSLSSVSSIGSSISSVNNKAVRRGDARQSRSSFRRENRNLLIAQATGQGAERHKFLASLREEGRLAARNQEEYKSDELFVSQSGPAWAW